MSSPNFKPWLIQPIRCAAKIGFLSRSLWDNVLGQGKPSWRAEQWRFLQSRGYFTVSPRYDFGNHILVLSGKGQKTAKKLGLKPVVTPPMADSVTHDEVAVEYAFRLEGNGLISDWKTESELKCEEFKHSNLSQSRKARSKLPDLKICLAIPGQPKWMAVEIEKTRKSNDRYNEFVNKYKGLADIDTVIVLAQSQRIIDAVKRAQVQTAFPQHLRPFVFGLLDQVMKSPGNASLELDGRSVSLESAVHLLRRKRNLDIARKTLTQPQSDRIKYGHKGVA